MSSSPSKQSDSRITPWPYISSPRCRSQAPSPWPYGSVAGNANVGADEVPETASESHPGTPRHFCSFLFTKKTGYWGHSSEEKTHLAIDFLKKLDIKEVDLLVSHSSGAYPAVELTAEHSDVQVKSLALLMPTTGTDVSRGDKTHLATAPRFSPKIPDLSDIRRSTLLTDATSVPAPHGHHVGQAGAVYSRFGSFFLDLRHGGLAVPNRRSLAGGWGKRDWAFRRHGRRSGYGAVTRPA
ncbi:hypothetical protein HPB49_006702 [Dermacentor silvarum]|uniref:Uncharacterized protein n=1 Tax=Dermacentor silvarum TaxID=543639 RepID=A0ACB8CVW5_DERSI|nr:hypothetical protein HPB49_006702 [Dermacentor silvarum]